MVVRRSKERGQAGDGYKEVRGWSAKDCLEKGSGCCLGAVDRQLLLLLIEGMVSAKRQKRRVNKEGEE